MADECIRATRGGREWGTAIAHQCSGDDARYNRRGVSGKNTQDVRSFVNSFLLRNDVVYLLQKRPPCFPAAKAILVLNIYKIYVKNSKLHKSSVLRLFTIFRIFHVKQLIWVTCRSTFHFTL